MGSFLGMKMDQYWMDLFLWEKFLNEHDLKLMIELGTGHGGMSTFLKLQCVQRNIHFMTFDNIASTPMGSPVPNAIDLKGSFLLRDIFSDDTLNLVVNTLAERGHPACIFFDDGDKPREWKRFAPYMAVGDYLVVHDWDTEFKAGDVVGNMTRIEESVDRFSYKTAWFQKAG